MAPRKRTGLVQVKLRISDDLKRRLDREAKKRDDGSLSAEIADRLERSFSSPPLEKAVATTVLNELSAGGWIVPVDQPKRGEGQ
jgi:hypothetical protein